MLSDRGENRTLLVWSRSQAGEEGGRRTVFRASDWCACVRRGRWEGVLNVMLGRGRMILDPLIPVLPRQRASGFHRPGRHGLHQAQTKRREVSG